MTEAHIHVDCAVNTIIAGCIYAEGYGLPWDHMDHVVPTKEEEDKKV